MIYRKEYIEKIMAYADMPFVKILTGIRRCGKSTILKMLMEQLQAQRGVEPEQIISFRFDSMEYEDMTAGEMYAALKKSIVKGKRTYFFLDEVQEIKGWEKVINSIAADFDTDLYITGSNSRMLSSEIETYLTGRYISFRIYTLSFAEYLEFKKNYDKPLDTHTELANYIRLGGFPATHLHPHSADEIYTIVRDIKPLDTHTELANYIRLGGFPATHLHPHSTDEIYTIVRDIYNSTVFSDIVRRNNIKKIDQLERIVKYTFQNVGNTFSAKSISDYLKAEKRSLDNETVYSYLENLEKAYILHRCSRYDLQGKEILKTQEKFYLADTSLRYSVMGYNESSVAASLENVVYLELCRRGYSVCIGKTADGEIDFVATNRGEKLYIQVTERIDSDKTEKREYERLLSISDNYPKYVLRTDEFAAGNYEGIETMHVADFLLSDRF